MELPRLDTSLAGLSIDQVRLERARAANAGQQGPGVPAADRPANDPAGLRQVANQFESLFYGQLIRAMRATVPESGFWGNEGASKIYRELHDQALADRMAGSGSLGIAELIVRQFQASVEEEGRPAQAVSNRAPRSPALPADPRGLSTYRRDAAFRAGSDGLASLRERALEVGGAAPDSLQRFERELKLAAGAAGLDPALVLAVVVRESAGDPGAVSPRGALGLMQLMPATARELGVGDPSDPMQNLVGGSRYLAAMLRRYDGDLDLALAAYNAGPGTVDRLGRRVPNYPETRRYISAVKDLARRLGAELGTNLVTREQTGPRQPVSR